MGMAIRPSAEVLTAIFRRSTEIAALTQRGAAWAVGEPGQVQRGNCGGVSPDDCTRFACSVPAGANDGSVAVDRFRARLDVMVQGPQVVNVAINPGH